MAERSPASIDRHLAGELFVREWFHPYEEHEVADLLARIGDG